MVPGVSWAAHSPNYLIPLRSLDEVASDDTRTGVSPNKPVTDLFNLGCGSLARAGPAPMRLWSEWGAGWKLSPRSLRL